MSNVAVIIANWNGKKYLKDCLDSLRSQTYKNFRIIFVDNGSEDGSVSWVQENFLVVEIIQLKKNTGFAHANNLGIQKAFEDKKIKYVITLNNDTKADKDYISELVKCAENHPDAGSIQPKVINFFDNNIIDAVGILIYKDASAINRGQKEKDNGQYEKEEEVFGASASAALYTREALKKIKFPENNYFDNDYFAYNEDVDLAWRLRFAGFSSFYCPTAMVLHVHSATGKSYSPFKAFHIHRNQYYNIIKNLPLWFMCRAFVFMPLRYLFLISSIICGRGPSAKLAKKVDNENERENVIRITLMAWMDVVNNLPGLIKKRKIIQKSKIVSNREIKRWLRIYKADFRKMIFS